MNTEMDFLQLLNSSETVSGQFKARSGSNLLMDLDLKNVKFQNCNFYGGDFCSSIFYECIFDNVVFKSSAMVGVTFENCNFIECKFVNLQEGYYFKNCKITSLVVTKEDK